MNRGAGDPLVKVCGLTVPLAESALDGVDLVGLNFVASSPRCVDIATAAAIARALPCRIAVVALFVNPTPDAVKKVTDALRVDWIQLHGDESASDCRRHGVPFIKAFRADGFDRLVARIPDFRDAPDHPYLLDAAVSGARGGTGQLIDLALARQVRDSLRGCMMLAGGLRPENVRGAVEQVRPWAVDVASGVEVSPGIKDPSRIAAFVRAAREAHD